MNTAEAIAKAIDDHWRNNQTSGHRYHLGASVLGRSCVREVWYKFHWWHAVRHTGRLLRLFNRGHREESHVVENLRKIGAVVEDVDVAGNQYKHTSLWGLLGGERDAAVSNLESFGLDGKGLLEIKTHGEKSFKALQDKGLLTSKPEHFIQMQMYIAWFELDWGLYYAVNKNTDEVYVAFVPRRPEVADQYTKRAREIITSPLPPKRISDDPTWWVCRFCDYKRHCHGESNDNGKELVVAQPDKNCRTCEHVELRLGDENDPSGHAWVCNLWGGEIPKQFTRKGCDSWNARQV